MRFLRRSKIRLHAEVKYSHRNVHSFVVGRDWHWPAGMPSTFTASHVATATFVWIRLLSDPGEFRRGSFQLRNRLPESGSLDLTDVDRSKATWLHLAVAVLPSGGGLAVLEVLLQMNP
jgi:hypothetical protein